MPLVGFICQDCRQTFDYLVRNAHQMPSEVTCSHCGSTVTQRAADQRPGTPRGPSDADAAHPPQDDPFSLKSLGKDLDKKR